MQPSNVDPKTITPETLGALLSSIFRPETEIIKQATEMLKKYFELPICLNALFIHATSNPDSNVRLLAAIYLRKRLIHHWPAQDPSFKTSIKEAILTAFFAEPVLKVKENLSYVIGVLSSILIPNNEWPEIFAFVMNKCQSTDGNEVEQGMILLSAICDSLGSALEPFIAPIMEILSKLIVVQHIHIQTLVVKTINSIMISNITTDSLIKFSALVPQMIQTVLDRKSVV